MYGIVNKSSFNTRRFHSLMVWYEYLNSLPNAVFVYNILWLLSCLWIYHTLFNRLQMGKYRNNVISDCILKGMFHFTVFSYLLAKADIFIFDVREKSMSNQNILYCSQFTKILSKYAQHLITNVTPEILQSVLKPSYISSPWVSSRHVKLQVAHAPGMPGTFSPSLRVSDPDRLHGTCMTLVSWCMPGSLTSGFLRRRWRVKHSRHSRRMCNPQFYVSGKRSVQNAQYHC